MLPVPPMGQVALADCVDPLGRITPKGNAHHWASLGDVPSVWRHGLEVRSVTDVARDLNTVAELVDQRYSAIAPAGWCETTLHPGGRCEVVRTHSVEWLDPSWISPPLVVDHLVRELWSLESGAAPVCPDDGGYVEHLLVGALWTGRGTFVGPIAMGVRWGAGSDGGAEAYGYALGLRCAQQDHPPADLDPGKVAAGIEQGMVVSKCRP